MDNQLQLLKEVNILLSELTYQILVNNIDMFQSVTPQTNMTTID